MFGIVWPSSNLIIIDHDGSHDNCNHFFNHEKYKANFNIEMKEKPYSNINASG